MKNLNSRIFLISRCFLLVALELVYFTSEWQNQYHSMPQGKMVTDTGEGNVYNLHFLILERIRKRNHIIPNNHQNLGMPLY